MNKLTLAKRVQILSMLVEGSSMRSISRVVDVSINTVTKLLVDAGKACEAFHDKEVQDVKFSRIQCDEIWSFCYAKAKNVSAAKAAPDEAGDVWTWTAIDSEAKLIISWMVGGRDAGYATEFITDLETHLSNRVKLTTDGLKAYLEAVEDVLGSAIDYAQLVKLYGDVSSHGLERKYSLSVCNGSQKRRIQGHLDMKYVSTSHVERYNLAMRMSMRRFTRFTNAFTKKLENHYHALALYFFCYNFVRIHKTLKVTPAMEAGITDHLYEVSDILSLIDKKQVPGKRGS